MNRFITFLKEVRTELGKVAWPTRQQLVRYTGIVIGISFFVAIFLGGIDAVLSWAISRIIS